MAKTECSACNGNGYEVEVDWDGVSKRAYDCRRCHGTGKDFGTNEDERDGQQQEEETR